MRQLAACTETAVLLDARLASTGTLLGALHPPLAATFGVRRPSILYQVMKTT